MHLCVQIFLVLYREKWSSRTIGIENAKIESLLGSLIANGQLGSRSSEQLREPRESFRE